jgi:2-dehydro-3-deoxygalactonokinase
VTSLAEFPTDMHARRGQRTVFCDWGTSRLRAYLQVDGEIVARREGPGIRAMTSPASATLREALQPWRNSPGFDEIVACGMVGSRNGIAEVPYVPAPTGLTEWASQALTPQIEELSLTIAAGVSGANAVGAPDVMRGEETQVFGAIAAHVTLASDRHDLLLPGTHSKWVQIHDGEIAAVHTYVTGELFALLSDHSSLLRAGDSGQSSDGGFVAGLARSRQSGLAQSLFETRAAQLLVGRPRAWAIEFLSGLLIGDEVASALHAHRLTSVLLIGESTLTQRYREALLAHGVTSMALDGDRCAVAGLRLLAAQRRQGL